MYVTHYTLKGHHTSEVLGTQWSRCPSKYDRLWHHISNSTSIIKINIRSNFEPTKYTSHLALITGLYHEYLKKIDCVITVTHYDDVIKWKHFPRNWPFVRGIHQSLVNYPYKGQWRGALTFFFDVSMNTRISKRSRRWWFETPSRSLWRHCNDFGTATQTEVADHFITLQIIIGAILVAIISLIWASEIGNTCDISNS